MVARVGDSHPGEPGSLRPLHEDIRACMRCPLAATRIHAVPGEGTADSGVMVVGEAPGRNEDETGRPFCGAAGRNLDLAFEAAGLERSRVFVTSIVKCRPPGNRDPKPQEKDACRPYLVEQVEKLRPRVLVALGRHGLHGLTGDLPGAFQQLRGRFLSSGSLGIPIFVSLHPAAVIYRQKWKEAYLDDWRRFGDWLRSGASPQAFAPGPRFEDS